MISTILISIIFAGCSSTNTNTNSSTTINTVGNTNGNINNGGIAAQQGDWIYYDNDGLYKIKTEGTEKIKICDDVARYINAAGNWIYYCNDADMDKLYKIKTDGTGRSRVSAL